MPLLGTFAANSARAYGMNVKLWKPMIATGGTVTTSGDYKYHVFNSSGTFTVTDAGTYGVTEYLVVAAGGGGGSDGDGGVAGGAGGFSYNASKATPVASYPVVVGTGAGSTIGGDSSFHSTISNGGGAGYGHLGTTSGGSGAGAILDSNPHTGSPSNQGNTGGATGYGNSGGNNQASPPYYGGGGGGAGAAGGNAAGPGGAGKYSASFSSWGADGGYYAGGAGTTSNKYGAGNLPGGIGGGGSGGSAGTANTGGGGGRGLAGGSGVVLIRYRINP